MSGDYKTMREIFEDVSVSYIILTSTDYQTANAKIAAKASHSIFVQKITLGVTVDNAATQLFQDSTGTPIEVAKTKASPGLGPIVFDFGSKGFQLTEGKSLDHKMSGTGMAASVTIEAYRKKTGVTASNV